MVDIIDDNFLICTDCLMLIANGDDSGLDYHYGRGAADRLAEIEAGIAAAGGNIVPGEFDRDEEFSTRDCDCCGSSLAGSRHHCVVLTSV